MIYVTANGMRVPVEGADLAAPLAGVEMIEVTPDNLDVVDGQFGGQPARSLLVKAQGFPDVMLVMPLAGAQQVGESLAKKKVEVVKTMPTGLR